MSHPHDDYEDEIYELHFMVKELVGTLEGCLDIIEYHVPDCKEREVAEEVLARIPKELK